MSKPAQEKQFDLYLTVGEALYVKLVAAFGGQDLYIGKKDSNSAKAIIEALGEDDYTTLYKILKGEKITVPLPTHAQILERNLLIHELAQKGLTAPEIRKQLKPIQWVIGTRRVQMICQKVSGDNTAKQIDLEF